MHRRKADPEAVTVYLAERLGNQLFMWAAGLTQARRLGVPLHFNLGYVRSRRPRRWHEKEMLLTSFDPGAVVPDDPARHVNPLLAMEGVHAAGLAHNLLGSLPWQQPGRRVFVERSFAYDDRIESVEPGVTLLGFFQSWRYFDAVVDEVVDRITALRDPSPWYREMSDRIRPGTGAVALHVRRGDYVTEEQQQIQGLATRGYYERALEHLRRLGLDGPTYVASDSLDAVLVEMDGLGPLLPLDPPEGIDPLELVLLLSRADGLVAANSSFSWWAGLLGGRHDIEVVAPRPWFTAAAMDTRDLLPPRWLTLDRGLAAAHTTVGGVAVGAAEARR